VTGTGSALPARAVSNDELAAQLASRGIETSDEWIVSRTGIRQRYLAAPGQGTADLAEAAARAALAAAGRSADEVDLIVLATSTAWCRPGSATPARRPSTSRRCAAVSSTR
jgi:3-oxoacyl-[acyl-carrier-protein] synthase-3